MGADTEMTRLARLSLLVVAAAGLLLGWLEFRFLTDDAYIAFRYASNSLAGHGLVWNPPPFRPVEGYTSFLWVIVLRTVWATTGVAPPQAANPIALAFSAGTLWLTWRLFRRMPLCGPLAALRAPLFGVVLAGVLTNRTFLAWTSSGLETAMFNFFLVWFVAEGLAPPSDRGATRLAAAASLAALSRPDGLLCVAGAVALLAADAFEHRSLVRLLRAWPLIAPLVHLVWRHATYGEWLPNTYYAKYLAPWPESGMRYAASFAVEYGVWVWLGLVVAFGWHGLRAGRPLHRTVWRARHAWVVVAVLVVHWGYYTFLIGGDHFEYRVYSHLVPLLWLSGVWMLSELGARPRSAFAVLGAWWLVSLPIPWVHWAATRGYETRGETEELIEPIAGRFAEPLRSVVAVWDGWQRWLISHNVCRRHQEHRVFHRKRVDELPPRALGRGYTWDQRNVLGVGSVGVLGWVFPGVAIIDSFGLNDYTVARLPPPPRPEGRQMAHDRKAPAAYVECFQPNVKLFPNYRKVAVRPRPLSDDAIRACEARDWSDAAREEFGAP